MIFLATSESGLSAEPAVIDSGFRSLALGQFTEYHLDPDHSESLPDILVLPQARWFSSDSETPSFGYSSDHLWLRIPVHNQSERLARLALEIAYPVLDHIDAYVIEHSNLVAQYKMGDSQPFKDRPTNHRNFVIPFELEPSATATIYIKVATSGTLQAPVVLWDYDHFFENQQITLVAQGLYLGIMTVMILYNLFIYFTVRHISYLFYTCAAISCASFVVALHGIGFQFIWGNIPSVNNVIIPASIAAFGFTSQLFTISLLNIRKLAPKLFILKMTFICSYLLLFAFSFVLPYHIAVLLTGFIGLPSSILSIFSGVYMLYLGQRAARFFLLAWSSLLISFVILSMNKFGFISSSVWIEHSVQIGSAMEVILLSFALADRINQERKAKHRAQQLALENEKQARQEQSRYLQLKYQSELDELRSQQQIYEAQAESKAKGDFLATMSHEIRTPMNGVLGMADLLQDTELNEKQRHYLSVITNSGKALLNVINDILDYSKITAGKMALEKIDFDLDQLCIECTSVFTVTAEQKNLQLVYSLEPGTPAFIKSDPSRLRQILLNLLGNAFKFTHKGMVSLRVSELPATDPRHHMLRFEVTDTGIGIDPKIQQKLFDAFSQADTTVSRQFGGTGLGLSISKNLAQLMGGDVGVESTPDAGSCFWFTICCESASPAFTSERIVPLSVLKGRRLLVVDRSEEFAAMVCKQAESWGMQVQHTQLGQQALNLLEQATATGTPFEIVTLEKHLSDMQGVECASKIKASERIADCRCILLTASHNQPSQEELSRSDVAFSMQKPTTARALRQAVISLLNGRKNSMHSSNGVTTSPIEGKMILVVEDNNVNQMVIIGMLKKLKLKYQVAENGQAALELYSQQPSQFDLILMDCEMPVMDGYTTSEKIRQLETEQNLNHIPIIALTAHVLREHRAKAIAVGMNAHLNKPIDFPQLEETLTQHLLFDEPDSARA